MKNNVTNFIGNVLILAILLFPVVSYAEVKEIVSEGAYNMGDGETPTAAESRALLQAKRTALEQAGTYVESYSKVKNFQLTEDEIQVLASGVMEVNVLEKKRTIIGDGFNFWVKIKAVVSTDKMEEMAKRVKEKSVLEDYKKIQEAYDKSQKEIQALKKQLAETKTAQGRENIKTEIAADEKLLQANEWFDKGYQYALNKEHDKAIKAYTSSIDLNPHEPSPYNNRGVAYHVKGQDDRAIEDYNKAISINQNFDLAYYNRGLAYANKGQYDRAIENYNKAIAINPNLAQAYYDRGLDYANKGQYDRAMEDYNKAISLKPDFAEAYVNRGSAYAKKGQYDRAIENYNKAIAINPNLDLAYYDRGLAYFKLNDYERSLSDFKVAARLGNKSAQDVLDNIEKQQATNTKENSLNVSSGNRPSLSTARETGRDGRFIAYDNGTVLDTGTGLMWAAKDNGSDINWANAKSYCENYRGGGYTDWRMPTQDELAELYDRRKSYRAAQADYNVNLTELIKLSSCCLWAVETRGSGASTFRFATGLLPLYHQYYGGNTRALPVRSGK